jgi:phosphohistidine phosphatase
VLVTLVVLRHAKSAWPDGVPDLERPLGERGRRDAPAAGRWLNENVPKVDLVLCSPAKRARETWEHASAELPTRPPVQVTSKIYDGPVLQVVQELPADIRTALIVGHNPDLQDLVEQLSGEAAEFKTSTIAVLESAQSWKTAGDQWARLVTLVTPRG